jgi:stage V sporulation protein B
MAWFLHYPAGAISTAVAPRLARSPGHEPQVGTYLDAMRYIVALQGLFLAPIIVWATPLMVTLLGEDYRESGDVLQALAPFVLLSGPALLASLAVNYLGAARKRVPLAVAVLVINVGVSVVLIPEIGIVGGAIATDLAYAVWVPAHILILRQLLDIPLRPQVLVFLRAAIAAGVACLPLVAFGTDPSIPILVLGCLVASLVYLLVLRLTGELTAADIDRMREIVGRRFPRVLPK